MNGSAYTCLPLSAGFLGQRPKQCRKKGTFPLKKHRGVCYENKQKKAHAFKRGAALAIAVVLFAGLAISCSNGSDSGGTPSITYVQVPYDKLDDYLTNQASETGINYIEITGAIPAADLKGSATDASALGKKLAGASPKKIGLKLPESIAGLTDMCYCFSGCNNVVGLAAIPHGVTSIEDCFRGCTALQNAPIIPEGVTSTVSYTHLTLPTNSRV